MQGLTLNSIKKNPSLVPLFACAIIGAAGATLYTIRLATKNPDVTWSNRRNPQPQNAYADKEYKLYSSVDMNTVEKVQIPKY